MTAINKSKGTIINWGLTSIFITICLLLSLIQSQEVYAEMKKVSGTWKQVKMLLGSDTLYGKTMVNFVNRLYVNSSADADWDKAKSFDVNYTINRTFQGDDFSGCTAITHPNGDQTFIQYDGSWKFVLPRDGFKWTSESKGKFTGGTGKFEGIWGTYTSKIKGDGQGNRTGEWEAEYEIVSTNN